MRAHYCMRKFYRLRNDKAEKELKKRMDSGLSFDKAKLNPVPFHKNNEIIIILLYFMTYN